MVKRTTIHVSSRIKMNHPKKWRVRIITKDKKGNEKKTTNTTYTIFYNQVTFAGKATTFAGKAGDGPDIGMQSMERNQFCTKNATTKIRKRYEA